ncbi:MAG: ferrous iron transport protein B [Corallococcus sp.]|nr:ferrous iron transport protein B [Corallococcus sp.]
MTAKENGNKLTVALCGNPNSGKTTLFNALTGNNQKVGNWTGVTVERKFGEYTGDSRITIVDTPGVYSLTPYSLDEQITADFLLDNDPDVIINVVDSTNLERSLLLTLQLLDLDVPVVIALNMQDEAEAKGISVNADILKEIFKRDFVGISAAKKLGLEELILCCRNTTPNSPFEFTKDAEREISEISALLRGGKNKRFRAIRLLSDAAREEREAFTETQLKQSEDAKRRLTKVFGKAPQIAFTEKRYAHIEKATSLACKVSDSQKAVKARQTTQKIDRILLDKWLAFPVFFAIMALIFYLSIDSVGKFLTNLINGRITPLLQSAVTDLLAPADNAPLTSLVTDGIIGGVMSVIGFVPQVMILFGLIAILEDCGYMARIAFITDRLLNKIGLGGRSFVAMILGCGCSVPAIMSTRTIKSANERYATITLAPFMPCSAKLAVISFFTSKIFDGNALTAISFYILSVCAVIAGGFLLKLLRRSKNAQDAFVMELPVYRAPTVKNVTRQMWERGKSFVIKAGTVIFAASVILWILQSFDFGFRMAETNDSMLAQIGKFISPVFRPLGFDDCGFGWQFSVATLSGIAAKETVVTTLEILLPDGISGCISGIGAYCFVTYNLLTVPCIAAISASFAEQGSLSNGLKTAAFQIAVAYAVTLIIYQTGTAFVRFKKTFVLIAVIAVIALLVAIAIVYSLKKRKCKGDCSSCGYKNRIR